MPVIRLPTEAEHGELVRKLDAIIRQHSGATSMTAFVRAAGLRPLFLLGTVEELAHVMATRTLTNEEKHIIALAVGSVVGSPYELAAQVTALQTQYRFTDAAIVELAAAIAHAYSLNAFERAMAAFKDLPPFAPMDASTPVLQEVRKELGGVPQLYRYMAHDAKFTKIVLKREKAAIIDPGEVPRIDKELVVYATSVLNGAALSVQQRADSLRQQGMTNEQLFEAATVVASFVKYASFTRTLQLESEGP